MMFLRALLVGYVIGLGGTLLVAPRPGDEPVAVARVQKQQQADPDSRLSRLRFDQPLR